jgi:hypothetical protein
VRCEEELSARLGDELDVTQHGSVVPVLHFGPYSFLGDGSVLEGRRRALAVGAEGKGGYEAMPEKDREDGEVLVRVVEAKMPETGTSAVAKVSAKFVREHRLSGWAGRPGEREGRLLH